MMIVISREVPVQGYRVTSERFPNREKVSSIGFIGGEMEFSSSVNNSHENLSLSFSSLGDLL